MKPFDLEKAKAGRQVCTRDGRPVRIIDFNIKSEGHPILALVDNGIEEIPQTYTKNGMWNNQKEESDYDLFMKETKKRGWINIYKNSLDGPYGHAYSYIWPTREEAIKHREDGPDFVDTIEIEWKE